MKYKYPIGTIIRYKGMCKADVGKEGRVVGWENSDIVRIIILDSFVARACYNDSSHSWTTYITNIEILAQKNQQLVFNFMLE